MFINNSFSNENRQRVEEINRCTDSAKGQQRETDSALNRKMDKHSKVIDAQSGRMVVLDIPFLSHHVVCVLCLLECVQNIHSVNLNSVIPQSTRYIHLSAPFVPR